jgi:phosphopantothenoylcysteine decarboxylase/phosphopantothenate--cysteine ligase
MLENSRRKLVHKNLDMIVANNLKVAGAGFAVDTNVITMITPGKEIALEMMSKDEAAEQILDEVLNENKMILSIVKGN